MRSHRDPPTRTRHRDPPTGNGAPAGTDCCTREWSSHREPAPGQASRARRSHRPPVCVGSAHKKGLPAPAACVGSAHEQLATSSRQGSRLHQGLTAPGLEQGGRANVAGLGRVRGGAGTRTGCHVLGRDAAHLLPWRSGSHALHAAHLLPWRSGDRALHAAHLVLRHAARQPSAVTRQRPKQQ